MTKRIFTLFTLFTVLIALIFLPGMAQAQPAADPVFTWGNGADGNLSIAAGSTYNIHVNNHPGRTCANGGDGVSYEVIGLTGRTATLSSSPASGCLKIGDEFILINLQGSTANTGNYELLRIQNLSANLVTFTTTKTKFYGANAGDDSGLGSSQKVVLQRVPNYNNLTVNGNLVGNVWDGKHFGLAVFRVKNNWIGSGVINLTAAGYRGGRSVPGSDAYMGAYQGESWLQMGTVSAAGNGGGGGGRNKDQTGGCSGGQGNFGGGVIAPKICSSDHGITYGTPKLDKLQFGSGGGGANDGSGGRGGGIVYVMANNASFSGTITTNGGSGLNSGGGSGGSIRIEGMKLVLGVLNAVGGAGISNGLGGVGRIAIYYVNSPSWSTASPPPYTQRISTPPTASPTLKLSATGSNTPNINATRTSIAKTRTAQRTPDYNATGTSLALTATAQVSTPDYNATGTSLARTATAMVASATPDYNATGTALSQTATAMMASSTPDYNATGTALSRTATALIVTSTPTPSPDYNATGTARAQTATAQAATSTPDFFASATAMWLTATARAASPTPDLNATGTAQSMTATAQAATSTPDYNATGTAQAQTATAAANSTPTPSGGGGNGAGDSTPTPGTSGASGAPGGSFGANCSMTLNVYVYVDGNSDSMMAAQGEGVNSLQVNFLDTSFGKLGQAYTSNGKASFCVPDYLRGQTLRVDIPYLQRTGVMQASQDNSNKNQPLEMWFRLMPPTLPLFIP